MIRHGTMTCTMSDPSATTPPPSAGRALGWWHGFLDLPRALRITTYVVLGLVLLLVVSLVTGIALVRRPLPESVSPSAGA